MRSTGITRLAVVAVLLFGLATACTGGGGGAAGGDADISVGGTRAGIGPNGEQQVIPTPLVASGGRAGGPAAQGGAVATPRRPPVPNLDRLRPTPPPNTVSLEELHQRGETHVLR